MIYVFGAYAFDTDRRVLRLAGMPVDLEPKVFDLLAYLIQHHDQFVSRSTLYEQLWSQQFVSEAALTYCIAEARKAVGDNGRAQRVIKTVHGRGYRFVAPVTARLPGSASEEAAAEACFHQARTIARHHQARSLELRAAMSLSRLWQQQGQ